MNVPTYNFQTTEPDKNLALNEYYFVCDYSGHFLKTKNKEEFEEVSQWNNILFSGKVKNTQSVHYKIGSSWKKKAFVRLKTFAPIEVGVFDFHILQDELSSHLTKLEIGGKTKAETYEML